jgi:hypothetical protein
MSASSDSVRRAVPQPTSGTAPSRGTPSSQAISEAQACCGALEAS